MGDRHRIVLVGGIPVDTFVALSRLLPPGSVVVSDHQHPRLLIPCRNSVRRPDQQLEPPAPPGPKPRPQRPILDL